MNEDCLERHLKNYREVSERVTVPPALTERILVATAGRARTRRFVRDARAVALVVGLLGATSALLASADAVRVEPLLAIQVGAWAEN
jgi:hypothetical protein